MSVRARLRAGEADAFGQLFDDYGKTVYNHAFRLVGDWSAAEDVMALTFLEAWRLRDRIEVEGGSLRPWLLGIATNVARNTRRAARRYDASMARVPVTDALPDFADDLVDRIDDTRRVAAMRAALSKLRRPELEVIALCVWSGLDYASAAQALGVPIGTVRSRLARARRKLQKSMAGQGELDLDGGQVNGDRENAARPQQEMTP